MDMISQLREEQETLRQRIQKIDELVEEYQRWEARVASLVQGNIIPTEAMAEAVVVKPPVAYANRTQANATSMEEFEKGVLDVLGRAEAPRNRTDLLSDLEGVGVVVGGRDARNTLSARLSRMREQVINIPSLGYWLRSRPYEPGNYLGSDDLLTPDAPEEEEAAGTAEAVDTKRTEDESNAPHEGQQPEVFG